MQRHDLQASQSRERSAARSMERAQQEKTFCYVVKTVPAASHSACLVRVDQGVGHSTGPSSAQVKGRERKVSQTGGNGMQNRIIERKRQAAASKEQYESKCTLRHRSQLLATDRDNRDQDV